MVPTSDFSGLTSCACALARAAAIVPIVSLERCTAILRVEEGEADCARFRALGTDAMADSFLGVLWHQGLQLSFGSLMIQKRLPCATEQVGKFRPRVRSSHVDDPDRRDPWFRRVDTEWARRFPALDTTPELALRGDNKML